MRSGNGRSAYAYRFSYALDGYRDDQIGANHSLEVPFVFGTLAEAFDVAPTEDDRRVSRQIQDYWVAFARTGLPAPEGLPEWPRYDPESEVLVDFRLEGPVVGPDPARERLDLAEAAAESRREAERSRRSRR